MSRSRRSSDVDEDTGAAAPVRVVVVCRANVFRSPIAAAMLRRRLAAIAIPSDVRSAGLAVGSQVADDGVARLSREWDLDLSGHETHQLNPGDVGAADLILTMEHHQVADIVALEPDAWPRIFTLKELVRRADEKGARSRGESFAAWIERVHAGRTRLGLVGAWHDDVADPAGRASSELDRTVAELDLLVGRLVQVAWPRAKRRR